MSPAETDQLLKLPHEYLAQDSSAKLMYISIAFIAITALFLPLFYASRFIQKAREETLVACVLIPLSALIVIGFCVLGILFIKIGGVGRHVEYHLLNNPTAITRFLQLRTAAEFMQVISNTTPKLVLLMLYLRIFVNKTARRLTQLTIAVVLLQWISFGIIVWASICQPFALRWNKSLDGHCGDFAAVYRYYSVPNILTDLAILLLPIPTVWYLQVSRVRKFGIFLTFLTGGGGMIAAIIRTVGFARADLARDPTYRASTTTLLTIAESGSYFVCACLPYLSPLLRKLYEVSGMSRFFSDANNNRSGSGATILAPSDQSKSRYSTEFSRSHRSSSEYNRFGFMELGEAKDVKSYSVVSA